MNIWEASNKRLRSLLTRGGLTRPQQSDQVLRAVEIAESLLARGHVGIGDPLRVFPLPLIQLNKFIAFRDFPGELPVFGVQDGDWDLKGRPIESLWIYRLCEEHFISGVPWQETAAFRQAAGRRALRANRNLDPPYQRYLDQLYEVIKTSGYRSQSELSRHRDSRGWRTRSGNPLNEVQVFVGREGDCMVKMGLHRTVIAKLLGLETIPVRTRVRHAQWQAIRDDLCRLGNADPLSDKASEYRNHPEALDTVFDLAPQPTG